MQYLNLIFTIAFLLLFFSFFSLAPFLPTKSKDLERINKFMSLKPWEKFLEIWCWTAKVSAFLAKNNPNTQIIWIELSPFFYAISKIKSIFLNYNNLKIIYWNALKQDFSNYDVLYIFWLEDTIKNKIFPKIRQEFKKDSRLFSYCFSAENDFLQETKYKESEKVLAIYEYRKKYV